MQNIEVYTIDNCGYCEAAKTLLRSRGLDFKEHNITADTRMRTDLVARTNHRTMPQIFIDGQFVGGYQELKEFMAKRP